MVQPSAEAGCVVSDDDALFTDDTDAARRRRAFEVAANARRFRLLARRPEFLSPLRSARIHYALDDEIGPTHLFDAAQLVGASVLDRFSGYVVALLNSSERRSVATLLDAIGILEPDRVAAIYFALKAEHRYEMRRDPACAYHVQQIEADVPAAETVLEEMLAATAETSEVGYDVARLDLFGTDA